MSKKKITCGDGEQQRHDCEWSAWCALYALSSTVNEERHAFEEHLSHCASCRAQVESIGQTLAELGKNSPVFDLARSAERLRAAVAPESGTLLSREGLLLARPSLMPWRPGPVPGIKVKVLAHDKARGYSTSLVQMDAGVKYPKHHHADVEEVWFLSGDCDMEGIRMFAGDYCRSEPNSIHSQASTQSGCVFLLHSSVQDRLLEQ